MLEGFGISHNFLLFIDGQAKYDYIKHNSENIYIDSPAYLNNQIRNEFSIGLSPGITVFLNHKLALESKLGSIDYRQSKVRDEDEPKKINKSKGINADFDLTTFVFGVSYYF